MKKLLFIASLLACLTACEKTETNSDPQPAEKEAQLVLEWKQSDNLKAYTNPLIAYRINGGDIVVEAPSSKSIDIPYGGGKVEIAFLSQETSNDLGTFVSETTAGEKASYHFYASVIVHDGNKESQSGSSFNFSPLSQSLIRDSEGRALITADELKSIVFDEFNCGSKYNPDDSQTKIYKCATGKDRKLVLTWESGGEYPQTQMSYEDGNLFQQP